MKTLTMFVLMLLTFFGNSQGQTITLTFTATFNGNHQPLDSIVVVNLTQGADTTLFGSDTVLVLDHGIGMDEIISGQLILYPASPNPLTHSAAVRLFLPRDEMVTLRAHDLVGREIVALKQWLPAGYHTFEFTPGNSACYLLSVEALGQKQVQRLVSLNGSGSNAMITYAGARGGLNTMRASLAALPWTPGDQLRFVGYSANGTDTLVGQPVQSIQYTFQYSSGFCPATLTDINGNVYNTIQIGTQCWMKENLKARNYKNGTTIPIITSGFTWANLSTGARCWFSNDSAAYANTYGALYNWYVVANSNGLCPTGWHVPTDAEWTILTGFFGGDSVAGGRLKETGTTHWNLPNTGANNSSGFTALPGGLRYDSGVCYGIGSYSYWWSSTATSSTTVINLGLSYNHSSVARYNDVKYFGFSVRCVSDSISTSASLPTISTDTVTSITNYTSVSGGNITNTGASFVTARGVCWSTNSNPTIADSTTIDGVGIGIYTSILTGLYPNTTYYVRAYASNSVGTAYGNEVSFTTLAVGVYPVYDIDGNGYDMVHIGTQVWMKQDLRTTKYRNGIPIPNITSNFTWPGITTSARCWYNNDSATYAATYGALYNWYAVDNSNGLCPTGWHVPTNAEWTILTDFLGGLSYAGGPLKETDTTHWLSPNTGATNSTGFTALPGGYRLTNGTFNYIGNYGYWWSSTANSSDYAWYRHLLYNASYVYKSNYLKKGGFSVRCVRDSMSTSASLPTILTDTVTSITNYTSISGGNITSDGGSAVTARGVCWSTSSNPTMADSTTNDGSGAGTYISNLTGLSPNTTYYVRAYASNSVGTAYGNEVSFTTSHVVGVYPVYDIDGNGYDTVHIGTQVWLKQNLNTTRYRNGTPIPNVTNNSQWPSISPGARCWYNNDSATYAFTYGALYNWYAVNNSNGLCPIGWHVPSDVEWTILTNFLGGSSVAGGPLKEAGTAHWNSPNTGATNSSGFTALPGGIRSSTSGNFSSIEDNGNWWSSSLASTTYAYYRTMHFNYINVSTSDFSKRYGLSVRCLNGNTSASLPTILTDTVTMISSSTALSGGNITSDGGSAVTARGVCWSINMNPTIAGSKTIDGTGVGIYTSNLTALFPNTTYYVRAYASNSIGTAYGNEVSFTTSQVAGTYSVYDVDGNGYDTVHISTQVWMKQNLKTTRYRNGTNIPNITSDPTWASLTTGSRCWYNNDSATYSATYGAMYNWYTVDNYNGLCPTGWHVPTDAEWTILTDFLGGLSVAGGPLKEAGTTHWNSPNTGATNSSGFTAFPGGYRNGYNGSFSNIEDNGYWWSTTVSSPTYAWNRGLSYNSSYVISGVGHKNYGFTVRCIKD